MSDEQSDYGLILPLDSDNEEFCRGFEAGRLYEMVRGDEEIHQMIHASNTEMAIRICEAADRRFHADQIDDDWTDLTVLASRGGLMTEDSVLDILCGANEDDSGEEASTFDLFVGSL